jgi:23S rRNA pseudouridine1911/1915/1917 synthase
MRLFAEKKIEKTYIAFVQGSLKPPEGRLSYAIEGKSAVTQYKTLEYRKDFTIIEATPQTGRTNQIRIHCKAAGHPVVGETKFSFRRDFALKAKRLCLHAAGLAFTHPFTGKEIRLESPLPADLRAFLERHP